MASPATSGIGYRNEICTAIRVSRATKRHGLMLVAEIAVEHPGSAAPCVGCLC